MTATTIHLPNGFQVHPSEIVAYVRSKPDWTTIHDVRRDVLRGRTDERPALHMVIRELLNAGELERDAESSLLRFRAKNGV